MSYHNRTNYWTSSQFANWIRGVKRPHTGTGKEWREWEKLAKKSHPIRFWIAEEGLRYLQNIVRWPTDMIYDAKCYLRNRFSDHTHALTAHSNHLKRGQWVDVGNRFLPCLFDTLVDFVEIELAYHNAFCDSAASKQFSAPWWSKAPFNFSTWRSQEAGLNYLDWAKKLVYNETWGVCPEDPNYNTLSEQAIQAKEIETLYLWYLNVYLKRPEPMDLSGWSAHCALMRKKYGSGIFNSDLETVEDRSNGDVAHKLLSKLEREYEEEDTEMMCRLIKVRHSLWT